MDLLTGEFSSEPISPRDLRDALANGCSVVTATRRLARSLQADFARASAAPSWTTPRVLPWPAWVTSCFMDLRDLDGALPPRACLDDWQAAALWEQVFSGDALAQSLLMPNGAVDGFRDAWRLAHEWCLPWDALQARAGEDGRAFLRLAARYREGLEHMGWLDRAQLPAQLAPALARQAGPEVIFAGFDALNPAQAALAAALGPRARHVRPASHPSAPTLQAFPDSRTELAAAAAWARRRLDQDPGARLGIVVPDLEAQAGLLEDLLDEALVPERLLPGRGDAARPWNLSLGRPLIDRPVIAAAFLAFALGRDSLEAGEASRLLRSPYLGGAAEEGSRRAALETRLREQPGDEIGVQRLLAWLDSRDAASGCPRLTAGIRGCLDEWHGGPRRRPPSAWSAALTRGLRRLGWPGDSPPDSPTWQALRAWSELLEAFSGLDAMVGSCTLAEAVARLRRIGAEQRFQPETPEVPVQVLGLLETAGLEFDGVWVTGLHDGALPMPLRPCALLPASLQRERGMPRACPVTELAAARRAVMRLAGAAPEVRFSHPLSREDEPLRASPVVALLPPPGEADAFAVPKVAARLFAARRLEAIADWQAPPVSGEVGGGSGLLAAQSACPFKAFAIHRLGSEALPAPAAGVDPAARGAFVHRALHLLWEELAGREALAALEPATREARVRAVLERAARDKLAGVPAGLVGIEIDEAARRIGELLATELTRPAFRVVAREHDVSVTLDALRIKARIDRLDRVEDGTVVIDYKTGAASAADWRGERPAEPQMPLYALVFADELAGLAYASLRPGDVKLAGVARTGAVFGPALPRFKAPSEAEWGELLQEWRRVLEALASAFAGGDARVDPLQPHGANGTCQWCHLATLCRRDELWRNGALGRD
jgi:ATP-dependent helicase/nuclease subunit B